MVITCSVILKPYPQRKEPKIYLRVVAGGHFRIAAIAAATPRQIILLASVLLTISAARGVHSVRSH